MAPHRLRVAIVAPSLRYVGGQSIQADRLIRGWLDDPDVEAWLVPHDPVPPPPFRQALRIKYVRTLVTEATYIPTLVSEILRADVVHIFSASYFSFLLAPLPAIQVARLLGRPAVVHYHSGEAADHLLRSPVARHTLAATSNVVPSRFLADVFSSFGLRADVIPNVIALHRFPFKTRTSLAPRLLSTRNFEANYDVATTLRAFRLILDRRPDATLTIVGGGREEPQLRTLARALRIDGAATFVGQVDPDVIAAYYADHDIYIQSPVVDNMPVSVLEAYASGLPVVSTDAGGMTSILTDGTHGLLAPCRDDGALANRVLQLLDDQVLATRITSNAFARCEAWTWPVVRDQWLSAYRRVLNDHTAESRVTADDPKPAA